MKPADTIFLFLIVVPWMMGVVLAKGFWSTTTAICLPPYAWYLVAERALIAIGGVS